MNDEHILTSLMAAFSYQGFEFRNVIKKGIGCQLKLL